MTEAAIRVEQLSVRYRGPLWGEPVAALDAVTLEARAGEIVALLGPNGSGKTTLLRVLAGVQQPSGGHARLNGESPGSRRLRSRVGWQPDAPPPLAHLRAPDLLAWLGTWQGWPVAHARAAAERWLERLGLAAHRRRRIKTFSAGM